MKQTECINALARRLRACYIAARCRFEVAVQGEESSYGAGTMARWDGGPDRRGVNHQPIWPKIARFVLDRRLNPDHLVQAVFAAHDDYRPPLPNALMNDRAETLARRYFQHSSEDIRITFRAEQRLATTLAMELRHRTTATDDAIWRAVITDPAPELTPLFRHCLAIQTGNVDLADRFREDALAQYAGSQQQYEAAMGEFIPPDLRMACQGVISNTG